MDPATWAAAVASMEAMAAEAAAAMGTAAAGTAAVAPEALFATAPAAGAFGALVPGTELAASMMLPAEAMPFVTELAPLAGEASIGFSAPGMAGMEAMMAPMTVSTTFPWDKAGKAALYGLAAGSGQPEQPRASGGRPPSGGGQGQPMPTFNYGAPAVEMPSMAELMRKREEMLRRRRGY